MSFILWVVGLGFYFAPTIVGLVNKKSGRDLAFIFLGNLFLGWTVIGWFMMAWKASKKEIR